MIIRLRRIWLFCPNWRLRYNWPWNEAAWVESREERHIRDDALPSSNSNPPAFPGGLGCPKDRHSTEGDGNFRMDQERWTNGRSA
jgi:hypothetical protein